MEKAVSTMPFFISILPFKDGLSSKEAGKKFCDKFNSLSKQERNSMSRFYPPFTVNGTKVVGDWTCVPPDETFYQAVLTPRNALYVEALRYVKDREILTNGRMSFKSEAALKKLGDVKEHGHSLTSVLNQRVLCA